MKQVELPEGILVTIDGDIASVVSGHLKEYCPYCGYADCDYSCDQSTYEEDEVSESEDEVKDRLIWNAAIDGLESMILACACENVDIESPAFSKAVQSALSAIENRLGA